MHAAPSAPFQRTVVVIAEAWNQLFRPDTPRKQKECPTDAGARLVEQQNGITLTCDCFRGAVDTASRLWREGDGLTGDVLRKDAIDLNENSVC